MLALKVSNKKYFTKNLLKKHFLLETALSNELVSKISVAQLPIHLLYKVVMIDPFQGHVLSVNCFLLQVVAIRTSKYSRIIPVANPQQ